MRGCGIRWEKLFLARALAATGLSSGLLRAQSLVYRRGYVRVVNYHGTLPEHAALFEDQVRFYAEHFCPVTIGDLDRFFENGGWNSPKPGLVISFDDGFRSNYDVAAPILDRYGFTGWFFVPVGFIDAPIGQQQDFARAHRIDFEQCPADGRLAMSWDELRTLATRHVVGCHTRTHRRMERAIPAADIEDEIVCARADLEERLGRPVETFCWVGGEERTYSAEAARVVRRAGYRYAFMTNKAPLTPGTDPFQVQRLNIEASWPLDVVRFQLSGVMDILSARERARVNRLTA
jgi:peptidoglycan/xylan/chitin deacetylase (PgdA/CDA1 family)